VLDFGSIVTWIIIGGIAGWMAGLIAFLFIALFSSGDSRGLLCGAIVVSIVMAIIVLAVWLLIFLPLYAVIPPHWRIAHWPMAALFGAICGALLVAVPIWPPQPNAWPLLLPAAIVGGASAAVGALTLDWSRRPRDSMART